MNRTTPQFDLSRATLVLLLAGAVLLGSLAGVTWATAPQNRVRQTVPPRTPTPEPASCPTETVLAPQWFTLTVDLQRPNAPPPDPSWSVPVHLTLHPPGDGATICHEWVLTLDQSGEWSGQLDAFKGLYDARLKNMHTLRNVRHNVEISVTNSINMGTLLEGDADNNNRIRISDFGILRNAYFTEEGDPDFDPRADFDEDGQIRVRDFSLLRLNYFKEGDIVAGASVGALGRASDLVDLRVEPLTTTIELGERGTVTITAYTGGQDVVGVEFELRFDARLLMPVDGVPGEDGVQVKPVGPLTEVLFNQVDTVGSEVRVRYAVGTFGDSVRGDIPLARLEIQGRAPTEGTSLRFTAADATDPLGRSVVGDPVGGVVMVTGELSRCYLPLVAKGRLSDE